MANRYLTALLLVFVLGCLPEEVPSTQGFVRVIERGTIVVQKDTVWGYFEAVNREIWLDSSMTRSQRFFVKEHETCHLALFDDNVYMKDSVLEERVCDAIAKQRLLTTRGYY